MSDAVYIALVGFLSAIAGGVIQAWANRNFEARKLERQNRIDAYLAYLNGISELSFARIEADKAKVNSKIADARGRIALSGSPEVIDSIVASFDFGSDLHSMRARQAHASVIAAMRADCLAQPGRNEPDDLFVMLYGRAKRDPSERSIDLPDWYPLANATDEEIAAWLAADPPPYDEMRAALPWLRDDDQLDAWLVGMRSGRERAKVGSAENLITLSVPPRRTAGRQNS